MKSSVVTIGLAVAATVASVAQERDLPRHELIFSHHVDAGRRDYDVWRICADGTQLASLVTAPGHQYQLAVSPDGTEFLYTSEADGQRDVFRKPFGRGDAVNLTNHPALDSSPAWSPDGSRIAFSSTRDAERPEIYVLTLATGAVEQLTDNAFHDSAPSWSPDGARIAFSRFFSKEALGAAEGAGEIVVVDVATRRETQLTKMGAGFNGGVSHSPDGKTISFHRTAGGRSEIWHMNADGTDARAITDTTIDEYDPQWSPDGQWIAFSAGTGHDGLGTFDLWIMRPDGTDRRVVSTAGNTQAWQKWRPNHYCR